MEVGKGLGGSGEGAGESVWLCYGVGVGLGGGRGLNCGGGRFGEEWGAEGWRVGNRVGGLGEKMKDLGKEHGWGMELEEGGGLRRKPGWAGKRGVRLGEVDRGFGKGGEFGGK